MTSCQISALCLALLLGAPATYAASSMSLLDSQYRNKAAITYTLPSGWKGSGAVARNENAASPMNRCVETMLLNKKADGVCALFLSAYETPSPKTHPSDDELVQMLDSVVAQLPGYEKDDLMLQSCAVTEAPQDLQEFRKGRDRIPEALGKEIDGRVYLLTATYTGLRNDAVGGNHTHNIVLGTVVHERTTHRWLRKNTTVAFHNITVLAGPVEVGKTIEKPASAPKLEKAMSDLARMADSSRYSREWLMEHIRNTANDIDGMPKLDERNLPTLAKKAEAGLKLGLPAVIAAMQAHYQPTSGLD